MNALGSPLDALALDYLSFGFLPVINNIWAWVALLTAAVSFWRMRTVGTVVTKSDIPDKLSPQMVSPSPHGEAEADKLSQPMVSQSPRGEDEAVREPTITSASLTTTSRRVAPSVAAVDTSEGATKGKFTVYYKADSEGEMASVGEVDDGGVAGFGVVGKGGGEYYYWCDNWDKVMRMRIGNDMEWYRYQDLTVLDGNVVRLWDCCRDKSTISLFGGATI